MTALAHPKPVRPPRATPKRIARKAPLRRSAVALKRGPAPRRRVRVKPRKTGATADLRREAEALCSAICRALAGHRCEYREPGMRRCSAVATDAAHALAKSSHPAVRFVLQCLIALCRRHHDLMQEACVARPSAMGDLFQLLRGLDAWEALIEQARKRGPYLPGHVKALRATAAALGTKATKW